MIYDIWHMTWFDVMWTWCDVMWCDVKWCDVMWYDIGYIIYDVMWCYVMWCDVIWYDMIWLDMIWYNMIWHDMTWHDTISTARQLCRINLLVPFCCLTDGGNPCKCQYRGYHHFCPVLVRLPSRECWFPHLSQRQRGAFLRWLHSALSHHCRQITNPNLSGNHANQYLAYDYSNYSAPRP